MNPISTALLSFGMSGKLFHGPFVHTHPGFRLSAVWERSRNEAAAAYPGIRTYRTLEEVLADDDIELVIVNTPNYTHYDYCRQALLAGKHVIVEKPFVTKSEEGAELISLAEEKGLHLSVYQNRRWDSDFRTVQRVLREGLVGNVVEAAIHFDRFKTTLSPKPHKEEANGGAGILFDLGPHIIDAALQLFGLPEALFADVRYLRPGTAVDDQFEILLYYPGLRVRLHSGYFVREPLPSFQLYGDKGTFLKARADVQERDLQEGRLPTDAGWGLEPAGAEGLLVLDNDGVAAPQSVPAEAGDYTEYFNGIYRSLRESARLPVTAAEGLAVVRIVEAAFRSSTEGCRVPLAWS
ncbi:Gfo/Idh/MocA family oxidoreductase [Flaviaesturariibacter amylovorans]|uniref:Gfo/Idh/MocA family oxidoreductase n=1 Tax=Flaviaesturariibacter amylovorans TaxID=1084520 RepID=A0ABP8GCA1_9BACT